MGLTGSIGAGKSSVARLLAARGAVVVDADALARQATDDPEVLQRIAAELGSELVVDGKLDRQATARLVFERPEAREALNAIVHPWVGAKRLEIEAEAAARPEPPPVIVHDVPLLFEVGLDEAMDVTLVVTAPLETRVRRVAARSGTSPDEVRARDAAQMPQEEKARRADFVIDNSAEGEGSEGPLERQVARLWPVLLARRAALEE